MLQEGESTIKNKVSSGLEGQSVPCYSNLKRKKSKFVISINFEKNTGSLLQSS
jgi:hypothetical protein